MKPDLLTPLKVTAAQQAKIAYVYIRQSSIQQVLRNSESTEVQYRLVELAVKLGWPRDRVQVIDEDLGQSGASAEQRVGFQFLMAEVGFGRVGLVLSFDASRLARNNSDWYRLLDVCSIFGTLIADGERLYDPRIYHDRLILGLSGMMSEAELHQIKLRLLTGRNQKAERGEFQVLLPVGLVRQRDGTVSLNPDAEVQARLHLIFAKFTELGSARAVRNYLLQEQLSVPAHRFQGPAPHDVVWGPPREATILRILHNPAYAGVYAFGKKGIDPLRRRPGRPHSGTIKLPIDKWAVCLQAVYPAYITWETYLANQAQLTANQAAFTKGGTGVPRQGSALLQGIVRCGRCDRRMAVKYSGPQGNYPVYHCGGHAHAFGGSVCQQVRALGVDREVERLFLAALEPERIILALDALEQLELELQTRDRQWQFRLERTRYEARRAQRQYDAVDCDNRLVARTLERQWEEKLRAVEQAEQEYETWRRERQSQITGPERQEILAIGADLPKVWRAPTTTDADRKHFFRLLIKEVMVDQKRERGKVWIQIHWQTGATTRQVITRTCMGYQDHGDLERIEQMVAALNRQGKTDRQIATELNLAGLRTTYGEPFQYQNVWNLRRLCGIPNVKEAGLQPDRLQWVDGSYTIQGVVKAVGVTKGTVHRWLKQGLIKGSQLGSYMLWRIALTDEEIEGLRQRAR